MVGSGNEGDFGDVFGHFVCGEDVYGAVIEAIDLVSVLRDGAA